MKDTAMDETPHSGRVQPPSVESLGLTTCDSHSQSVEREIVLERKSSPDSDSVLPSPMCESAECKVGNSSTWDLLQDGEMLAVPKDSNSKDDLNRPYLHTSQFVMPNGVEESIVSDNSVAGSQSLRAVNDPVLPSNDVSTEFDASTYLRLNLLTEFARSKSLSVNCNFQGSATSLNKPEQGTSTCTSGYSNTDSIAGRTMKKAKYSWQVKNLNGTSVKCLGLEAAPKPVAEVESKRSKEYIPNKGKESKRSWTKDPNSSSSTCVSKSDYCGPKPKRTMLAYDRNKDTDQTRIEIIPTNKNLHTTNEQGKSSSKTNLLAGKKDLATSESSTSTCVSSVQCNAVSESEKENLVLRQRNPPAELTMPTSGSTDEDSDYHRRHESIIHHSNWADKVSNLNRWQNQQVAKSIVDNAINKTIEDLGFSPSTCNPTSASILANQCRSVESQAVSAAIQQRGLLSQVPNTIDPPQGQPSTLLYRLHPIIDQMTHFSENIFAQNMYVPTRYPGVDTASSIETTIDVEAVQEHDTSNLSNSSACNGRNATSDNPGSCNTSSSFSASFAEVDSQSDPTNADVDMVDPFGSFAAPSTNDIINQAVAAAISQRGLSVGNSSTSQ